MFCTPMPISCVFICIYNGYTGLKARAKNNALHHTARINARGSCRCTNRFAVHGDILHIRCAFQSHTPQLPNWPVSEHCAARGFFVGGYCHEQQHWKAVNTVATVLRTDRAPGVLFRILAGDTVWTVLCAALLYFLSMCAFGIFFTPYTAKHRRILARYAIRQRV